MGAWERSDPVFRGEAARPAIGPMAATTAPARAQRARRQRAQRARRQRAQRASSRTGAEARRG